MLWLFLFLPALSLPASAGAPEQLEEIVVRPPIETASAVVDVPEGLPARPVTEALAEISGVAAAQAGGPGQPSSVFIRGAKSAQTLVFVDGFPVADAAGIARGFDLAALSTADVERIEVHRGPQSVRFGGDAVGGVINIVTKRGREPSRRWSLEGGSYGSGRAEVSATGWNSSVTLSRSVTDAFSAASGGAEADSSRQWSFSARAGGELGATAAELVLRWADAQTALDNGGGAAADDPNYFSRVRQALVGVSLKRSSLERRLESSYRFSYADGARVYDNDPDAAHADDYHEKFDSGLASAETWQRWNLAGRKWLELGLQHRSERGSSRQFYNGFYSELASARQATTGAALIFSDEFDGGGPEKNVVGWRLGARGDTWAPAGKSFASGMAEMYWEFGAMRWGTAYGTGFKTPSLFQLHSSFGNKALRAEEARGGELSLERRFFETALVRAAVFENRYEQLIDYDGAKYGNVARASSRGSELELAFAPVDGISVRGSATALRAWDEARDRELARRPPTVFAASVEWVHAGRACTLALRGTGERPDSDPVTLTPVRLPGYEVWNAVCSLETGVALKLSARVDNLFDRMYEEIAGFATARRSFVVGLTGEL